MFLTKRPKHTIIGMKSIAVDLSVNAKINLRKACSIIREQSIIIRNEYFVFILFHCPKILSKRWITDELPAVSVTAKEIAIVTTYIDFIFPDTPDSR